jgi:hypothetical protein
MAIAILTLTALLLSGVPTQPARANPGWWDPAWRYRKAITVTELSGSALTDYQIKIDLSYEPAMRADFGDLRFTSAADSPLDYWLEAKTDGISATVWVEVDAIAASDDTVIYMYYGNPAATDAGDGNATFIFFDDFSDDLSRWNIHIDTDVAINASYGQPAPCLELSGGSTSGYPYGLAVIGSDATYSGFQDGIIEADIYPTTNALPEIIFRGNYTANTGYKGRWDTRSGNETPWMMPPYATWSGFGSAVPRFGLANQWQKAKLVINGSTFRIYSSDSLKSTETFTDYPGPGEIGLANHYGAYARFDNVRVRQYASPEPTCAIGPEESNSPPDVPTLDSPGDGATDIVLTPDLVFDYSDTDSDDCAGFDLQVDDDPGFGSPDIDESDYSTGGPWSSGSSITYTVSSPLAPDTQYYWRVNVSDGADWSGWSDGSWDFTTGIQAGGPDKNEYRTTDNVYVSATGFPPDSNVDVYVVNEGEWSGGETIADYGIMVMKTVTTDSDGDIVNERIWYHPLIRGEYDVVFDADQNGVYDEIPDLVDHPNHPGFTVVKTTVGGEVYPVDKTSLLLPWLGLGFALILAAGGLILARRAGRLR